MAKDGNPRGGEQMKNKLLLERLIELNTLPRVVNTSQWRKRPWCLVRMIWVLLTTGRNTSIILSASHASGKLIKIIPMFARPGNVIYWSVGGDLDARVDNHEFSIESLNKLRKIIVQGRKQADALTSRGLRIVLSVPNSKPIPSITIPSETVFNGRFVYLSRIHPQKGVREIVQASKIIKNNYPDLKFFVDFYGGVEKSFNDEFEKIIEESENCVYKGYLDLTNKKGYEKLSKYGCFLFPTYWPGEGFPGAIIDSYISGLPIIATRWNLNEEMIEEGKTGYLIEKMDVDGLVKAMVAFLNGSTPYSSMRSRCQREALKYDRNKVLSEQLFTKLGII